MLRWDPNPYALAVVFAAIGSVLAVSPIVWRKRALPGGWALFVLSLATFWWTLGYGIELGAPGLQMKLLLTDIEYLGIASVPLSWFCFVLQYNYHGKWVTRRRLLALLAIPLATVLLIWTNDWHGLMQTKISLDTTGPFPAIRKTYGPWFWVYYAYVISLLATATCVLLRGLFHTPRQHHRQTWALLFAIFCPWAVNVLHIARIYPIHRLDLTPLAFSVSVIALVWGLRRASLFDLLPVARDVAVREMGEGMIIVSHDLAILDANPAACVLVPEAGSGLVGRLITEVIPPIEGLLGDSPEAIHVEWTPLRDENPVDVEVYGWPLADHRKRRVGYVISLHDVSERRRAERALADAGDRMIRLHNHALHLAGLEREADVYAYAAWTSEKELHAAKCTVFTSTRDTLERAAADLLHVNESIALSGPHVCAAAYAGARTLRFDTPDDVPPDCAVPLPWRSGLCIPMKGVGVLFLTAIREIAFSDADETWTQLFAQHVEEAVRRIRLQEELREQARRDALTGTFNRHHFLEAISAEIARATRRDYPLAFIMLDVNAFKQINDRFGHQVGDRVLRDIGRLLVQHVRSYDLVIRYGGDEFLLVIPESSSRDEGASVLQRLQSALASWNDEVSTIPVRLSFAVGVAHWHPRENRPWAEVVEDADRAMYEDKACQ